MKKTPSLSSSKIFFILAGLGFLIYSNTFKFSFVFDDFQAIVNNPSIRSLDLIALWHAFNTRFVVGVSLAVNYALGQDNVTGYHLFNTVVHILNAFLVYKLVCLTPKTSKLLGFLVALIFLVHPVQTQAVTYIWQRATSLATFFYLGALVFYVRGRLRVGSSLLSPTSYLLSLLFTVLGMFTKEIVFTLPFAILLYEVIFLREIPLKTKQKMLLWAPFALSLLIIPLTMTQADGRTLQFLRLGDNHFSSSLEKTPVNDLLRMTRVVDADRMPRTDFILTELNVLRTYLRLFILPVNQSVDYDYPRARSLMEPGTLLSLLLLLSLFGSGLLLLKKHPLLSFGILWFFLTVSVEVLVAQEEFIFEHRMYLPMVGLSLFLVAGLNHLLKNNSRRLTIILLGVVACLSFMTYQRNFVWKEIFTLWDDAIQKNHRTSRTYNGRATGLVRKGLMVQALQDYNKAIELAPRNAEAIANRGYLYEKKGLFHKALRDFDQAIALDPTLADAYINRGVVHINQNLFGQALLDFNKAIEIAPQSAIAYSNRASVYWTQGHFEQALADCDRAIQLDPNFAHSYNNRGVLYKDKGLLDQALADFTKAIQLEPNNAEAYRNRGFIYIKKELPEKALIDFNKTIALDPSHAAAYNDRGTIYGMKNIPDKALLDFNKAIELNPKFSSAYFNRANLYFLRKEYDKSWQDVEKAQSLGFKGESSFIEQLKKASGKNE